MRYQFFYQQLKSNNFHKSRRIKFINYIIIVRSISRSMPWIPPSGAACCVSLQSGDFAEISDQHPSSTGNAAVWACEFHCDDPSWKKEIRLTMSCIRAKVVMVFCFWFHTIRRQRQMSLNYIFYLKWSLYLLYCRYPYLGM
jgi:hypothetical protein